MITSDQIIARAKTLVFPYGGWDWDNIGVHERKKLMDQAREQLEKEDVLKRLAKLEEYVFGDPTHRVPVIR